MRSQGGKAGRDRIINERHKNFLYDASAIEHFKDKEELTQEQLSEKLFVSRTAVSKWERNAGYPNIDSLKLIAEVFGVTLDNLLSSEEIIEIAKEEKKIAVKNLVDLFAAIINISVILLIILPLYKLKEDNFIRSVSIFAGDMLPLFKITFALTISLIAICGTIQLLLYCIKIERYSNLLKWISICLLIMLTVLLIATLEPYAAVLCFILLGLRVGLIIQFKAK